MALYITSKFDCKQVLYHVSACMYIVDTRTFSVTTCMQIHSVYVCHTGVIGS